MRALVAFVPGLVLLGGIAGSRDARAAIQTVSTQALTQNVQGTSDPGNLLGQPRVSLSRQVMGYQVEGLKLFGPGSWTLSSSMTTTQPDYSSYFVTERGGARFALSQKAELAQVEFSAGAGVTWDAGPHSVSVSGYGNLNASPFAVQSFKASLSEAFFERTTVVGVRVGVSRARQPVSAYIGSDFVTRERPGEIHANELSMSVDQVLSEQLKAGVELATAQRIEDRPRSVGGTVSAAYALSDRWFTRLAATRLDELRSQSARRLKDERGYFSLTAVEASVTYEPWIDWLVTPSYAWVIEDENDPRTERAVRVGSDQLGLALRIRRGAWEFDLKGAYRVTNTRLQDASLGGGLKWRI